jgi:hypothetical protein
MDNSMCHNQRHIQKYFAHEAVTRVSHPVYLPDRSPRDFWFLGYAKERTNNQTIMSEDGLEDKLTEVWKTIKVERKTARQLKKTR